MVSVKDGIDVATGAVNNPDAVPAGATAVTFNLTATETGSAGFLATTPGDAPDAGSSSINWSTSGQTAANGTLVKLDDNLQMKVFAGGAPDASSQFIVDITGYTI